MGGWQWRKWSIRVSVFSRGRVPRPGTRHSHGTADADFSSIFALAGRGGAEGGPARPHPQRAARPSPRQCDSGHWCRTPSHATPRVLTTRLSGSSAVGTAFRGFAAPRSLRQLGTFGVDGAGQGATRLSRGSDAKAERPEPRQYTGDVRVASVRPRPAPPRPATLNSEG